MLTLRAANELCRLLSDPTRVRLVALLASEELTVAELTEVTGLAQSRVSTHLGRLREAGMVQQRKNGAASFYAAEEAAIPEPARALWRNLMATLDDPTLARDRERARALVEARSDSSTWADSVAGQMERHYSPGRTWETYLRGLMGLVDLGDVVDLASGDGAIAEILVPRARTVTCLDVSRAVVEAGRARFRDRPRVQFVQGDLHQLPFDDEAFDQALMMNALTYASDAPAAIAEAARVLRPGGVLIVTTLLAHEHLETVAAYNHVVMGFVPSDLSGLLTTSGFEVDLCEVTHEERRAPHFRVITASARKKESI